MSGDVFNESKWRKYYDLLGQSIAKTKGGGSTYRSNAVVVGSVIGMLVDIDRGFINFYKDGKDLGQAFC